MTGAGSLIGCRRGAIYVEALVIIPVLATLWMIVLFIERGNTVDDETVERSRHCAWRFAADQCEGAPPRCEIDGPETIDGTELDGASGGALSRLGQLFPFLAGELQDPHGRYFRVTTRDRLDRPFGWGAIDVESHQSRMCQTPRGIWRAPLVFAATCAWYALTFCSVNLVSLDLLGGSSSTTPTTVIPIDGTAAPRLEAWRAARR
jgi:hypothetical protein